MIGSKLNILVKKSLPLVIALLSFSILLTGSFIFTNYKQDILEKDMKARLSEILMTKKSKLEKALYSRIHYTKSVAAYVSVVPDISNSEFYNLAQQLIDNDSVISTMALSKNCILNAIYPLVGHEAAIGLNLLSHPERREIVEKTIETHSTFIAGPVELIEGGIAF
ncbi:MAG: CHASE domain-containing protein [Bacteroidota bacterium]